MPRKSRTGPRTVYLDKAREELLLGKSKRDKEGRAVPDAGQRILRNQLAAQARMMRGSLKEKLRAEMGEQNYMMLNNPGRYPEESRRLHQDSRYLEYQRAHSALLKSVRNREPIAMRGGDVISMVFAHDYVGPVEARGFLAPLWAKIKPPVDSEPFHEIHDTIGRRVGIGRAHWALVPQRMRASDVVLYPATSGHGPQIRKSVPEGFEGLDVRGMYVHQIPEVIQYGQVYADRLRRLPKTRRNQGMAGYSHAVTKRLSQEAGELPGWTPRAERLMRPSPLNISVPTLWGRSTPIPGLKLAPLREARRQLRP